MLLRTFSIAFLYYLLSFHPDQDSEWRGGLGMSLYSVQSDLHSTLQIKREAFGNSLLKDKSWPELKSLKTQKLLVYQSKV